MIGRPRARRVTLAALLGLTTLLPATTTTHAQGGLPRGCQSVGGTFLANFIDPKTGVAVLTGDLNGSVRGLLLKSAHDANGTLHFTLAHVIVMTSGDTLRTSDQSVLTPVGGNVYF